MRSRAALAAIVPVFLAACNAEVPNSARGAAFTDYNTYSAQREAALQGGTFTPPGPVVAAGPGGLPGTPSGPVPPGAPQTTEDLGPVDVNNPGISDEQNFQAVASRETIESDAERLARQRAMRQQAAVEPLPERPRDIGPNIVEYALTTTNSVGQPIYQRRRVSEERHLRNCARYASPDRAQEAFLASGGPDRDRERLDPDGDGFACAWDPAPFRAARAAGRAPQAVTTSAGSEAASIAADALSAVGSSQ